MVSLRIRGVDITNRRIFHKWDQFFIHHKNNPKYCFTQKGKKGEITFCRVAPSIYTTAASLEAAVEGKKVKVFLANEDRDNEPITAIVCINDKKLLDEADWLTINEKLLKDALYGMYSDPHYSLTSGKLEDFYCAQIQLED